MNSDKITFLKDTLNCINRGYYFYKNEKKTLSLSHGKITDALVFLPEDIASLRKLGGEACAKALKCSVKDADAFSSAMNIKCGDSEKPVLVLNFANAVHPGGGVRRGSRAQEEDLCRTSTLLLSLEGLEAQKYYAYNRNVNSYLGSDAVIVSPHVEVFRDRRGEYLEFPFEAAVLTCAAPDLKRFGDIDKTEYIKLFTERIESVFLTAAYLGYKKLVLGAWGCGAFGNSPRIVSDIFYSVITRFELFGNTPCSLFDEIVFAVPFGKTDHTNYYEFKRNFCDFRIPGSPAEIPEQTGNFHTAGNKSFDRINDRVKGCFIGGAAGDALGYPVEFLTNSGIKGKYGKNGICSYSLSEGKALISDDTQMLLFTAQGILEEKGKPEINIANAYLDWYKTQNLDFDSIAQSQRKGLLAHPELYNLRAPGNACLSALEKRITQNNPSADFISEHINMSKGCGGIMRAAPCAFYKMAADDESLKENAMLAAQSSAVTHGHPLGYMSSAMLAVVISKCLVRQGESLKEIVTDSLRITDELFKGEKYLEALDEAVLNAVQLSENGKEDTVNLRKLGEGWVAEETLAVALYCSLKYSSDFSAGIIAAVNHSGDSDSTGAVAGNILGAFLGFEAIGEKWKQNLELYDVITDMAEKCSKRLLTGCDELKSCETETSSLKDYKLLCFAGSVMETDRLTAIIRYLRDKAETVMCTASPENAAEDAVKALGYDAAYSFHQEYISGGDFAADLIPLFTEIIEKEKPDIVVYVSSSECGFAGSIAAANPGINTAAISCGVRYGTGDRYDLMRSACDASALWRVAANETAYRALINEGFEKESIMLPDSSEKEISDKIMEILQNEKYNS